MVTTQRSTTCMRYNKAARGCRWQKGSLPCVVRVTHARDERTNLILEIDGSDVLKWRGPQEL